MNNLEYLMMNNPELLLEMVEESDDTNTEKPWCKHFTDENGDCPEHITCGICRRAWLESEHVEPVEGKAQFVADVMEALIKNGAGRYDHLMNKSCQYCTDKYGTEFVRWGYQEVNVSGDSLTTIMHVIAGMF